jgi:hypothetical protein
MKGETKMENTELNEVVTTEAAENIAEAIPNGESGMKSSTVIGLSMAAGAMLWELGIKPVGKKALAWIAAKRATRKNKAKGDTDEEPVEPEESEE